MGKSVSNPFCESDRLASPLDVLYLRVWIINTKYPYLHTTYLTLLVCKPCQEIGTRPESIREHPRVAFGALGASSRNMNGRHPYLVCCLNRLSCI